MPSLVSDVDVQARRVKTALLYRNAGPAQLVNVVNGSLLAYVNATLQGATVATFLWWLSIAILAFGRYVLARRFMAASLTSKSDGKWRSHYVIATTIAAVAWGAGTVFFIWNAPDGVRFFTALVLAGMVAGAVPLLAPVPAAFKCFAFPAIVPMSLAVFLQASSPLHWAFGAMTLVFLAAVLASARYLHETLDGAIRLSVEKGKIESGLQVSEQKLRAIADNVSAVLFLKDLAGRYLYVNRKYETLFHVSNDSIQGRTDHDIFPRKIADVLYRNDQIVVQTARPFEVEEVVPHADSIHTYSSVKVPVRDATGEIYAVCGIATDITERKKIESDLRIGAVAFESQEGMVVTDANSHILRVNKAFTASTGYSGEDCVGKTPRILQSGRHDAQFYREMWDSIHRTGGWQGEIWDRRKDGSEFPKWLTISSVKNDDGLVTNYIGAHHDITERKKAEEKIAELAYFDSLTGLPNRILLMDRLKQAMTTGNRAGTVAALLFIDLDHFKTLNDTLGHDQGDRLLQLVSQRLLGCVRDGDTVARLGGDEFVVLIEGLSEGLQDAATETRIVGEKILASMGRPYQLAAVEHRCTASIGATLFIGQETSIDDLLRQADLAMYKAKEFGRNTLRFFDPAMQTAVMARATMEQSLRRAILEEQFVLHYQAQVVGNDGKVAGAEALVRWIHPEEGMVPPSDFIPLAEETGLILALGTWVLRTSCSQLATWAHHSAMAHLSIAVNVSPKQFREHDFVETVLAVLDETGADAGLLKLELTEGLLVDDVQDIIEKMNALKARGVCFSLDDFGTGYSSLSYLSRLPLDQLKIDRSFVAQIEIDENSVAICAATVGLAHSLRLEVVAEGVETEAQRHFLSTVHKCDYLQGYLFSRPLPIHAFEAFVLERVRLPQ